MSHNLIASISFIAVCALICAVTQSLGAFFCLAVSLCLFGFVLWIEKEKRNDMQTLKDQVSELQSKVSSINLARMVR